MITLKSCPARDSRSGGKYIHRPATFSSMKYTDAANSSSRNSVLRRVCPPRLLAVHQTISTLDRSPQLSACLCLCVIRRASSHVPRFPGCQVRSRQVGSASPTRSPEASRRARRVRVRFVRSSVGYKCVKGWYGLQLVRAMPGGEDESCGVDSYVASWFSSSAASQQPNKYNATSQSAAV